MTDFALSEFTGMLGPTLSELNHAVSQSTFILTSQSLLSNVVGNECSESMREMCECVSFSLSANAQVYAPQSSWNVQELKETGQAN